MKITRLYLKFLFILCITITNFSLKNCKVHRTNVKKEADKQRNKITIIIFKTNDFSVKFSPNDFERLLLTFKGVSHIHIMGIPRAQIEIELDRQKIKRYNLPMNKIKEKVSLIRKRFRAYRDLSEITKILFVNPKGYKIPLSVFAIIKLKLIRTKEFSYKNKPAIRINIHLIEGRKPFSKIIEFSKNYMKKYKLNGELIYN